MGMKKLLLVDGSNIVMRAAFGGDIEPERSVVIATGLIHRAIRQSEASHLIVAMDADAPSWRKLEFPEYKADRTLDTSPWLHAAHESWLRLGWYIEECGGFEADDVIATIADRASKVSEVVAVSNDSDILALADIGIKILRPENGGTFKLFHAMDVCTKYKLRFAGQLTDYKAMTGESSDNVPGVPGIGPKRASDLLRAHDNLTEIISWGATQGACKYSKQVYECREAALLALRLVTLRKDAPISPIKPANCLIK
jgi:DNA polymerase I